MYQDDKNLIHDVTVRERPSAPFLRPQLHQVESTGTRAAGDLRVVESMVCTGNKYGSSMVHSG